MRSPSPSSNFALLQTPVPSRSSRSTTAVGASSYHYDLPPAHVHSHADSLRMRHASDESIIDHGSPDLIPSMLEDEPIEEALPSPHVTMSKEDWLRLGGFTDAERAQQEACLPMPRIRVDAMGAPYSVVDPGFVASPDYAFPPVAPGTLTPTRAPIFDDSRLSISPALLSSEFSPPLESPGSTESTPAIRRSPRKLTRGKGQVSSMGPSPSGPNYNPRGSPYGKTTQYGIPKAPEAAAAAFSSYVLNPPEKPKTVLPPPKAVPVSTPRTKNKRHPEGHIPRPRNAFILFRSHAVTARLIPVELSITDHRSVSRIVGEIWKGLPEDERQGWDMLAEEEKRAHREKYPDYKYTPKSKATFPAVRAKAGSRKKKDSNHNNSGLTDEQMLVERKRCQLVAMGLLDGDAIETIDASVAAGTATQGQYHADSMKRRREWQDRNYVGSSGRAMETWGDEPEYFAKPRPRTPTPPPLIPGEDIVVSTPRAPSTPSTSLVSYPPAFPPSIQYGPSRFSAPVRVPNGKMVTPVPPRPFKHSRLARRSNPPGSAPEPSGPAATSPFNNVAYLPPPPTTPTPSSRPPFRTGRLASPPSSPSLSPIPNPFDRTDAIPISIPNPFDDPAATFAVSSYVDAFAPPMLATELELASPFIHGHDNSSFFGELNGQRKPSLGRWELRKPSQTISRREMLARQEEEDLGFGRAFGTTRKASFALERDSFLADAGLGDSTMAYNWSDELLAGGTSISHAGDGLGFSSFLSTTSGAHTRSMSKGRDSFSMPGQHPAQTFHFGSLDIFAAPAPAQARTLYKPSERAPSYNFGPRGSLGGSTASSALKDSFLFSNTPFAGEGLWNSLESLRTAYESPVGAFSLVPEEISVH